SILITRAHVRLIFFDDRNHRGNFFHRRYRQGCHRHGASHGSHGRAGVSHLTARRSDLADRSILRHQCVAVVLRAQLCRNFAAALADDVRHSSRYDAWVIIDAGGDTLVTTAALGVALALYSLYTLVARQLSVPASNERWMSPFIGVVTGVITGATG